MVWLITPNVWTMTLIVTFGILVYILVTGVPVIVMPPTNCIPFYLVFRKTPVLSIPLTMSRLLPWSSSAQETVTDASPTDLQELTEMDRSTFEQTYIT